MPLILRLFKPLLLCAVIAALFSSVAAQNVKRVVIIKIDGLPGYYVDKYVNTRQPVTGRSELPWIDEVFYKNGTRIENFYTRGMSLSGPSWGQIDTGRHLQIKGNVEYDRYTLHAYDYLNFFPYYLSYALGQKVDMPAVEVMDQLHIPLLSDAFDPDNKYTSHQLYQRGNDWKVLGGGVANLYPGNAADFLSEWTIGFNARTITIRQAERDIVGKVIKRDEIDYFDYYDTEFDHISHHNNDADSRLVGLKGIDRVVGNIWSAIQSSRRADETALVLVSDHGFNSGEKVMSQGFNIVKMLNSPEGGSHHVVTKRRLMMNYSVKGLYPLTPILRTASKSSRYLNGKSDPYPTALVDFDGNERSSVHLRNSDLNIMHILLQQIQKGKLSPELRFAASRAFFRIVDNYRSHWAKTIDELEEELGALQRSTAKEDAWVKNNKPPVGVARTQAVTESYRRAAEEVRMAEDTMQQFRAYTRSLQKLIKLERGADLRRESIEDLIAPGAMGGPNTLHQLQNYVSDIGTRGLILTPQNEVDLEKSFSRVDYFDLLHSRRVRSNVQAELSNKPIDFVAFRIPGGLLQNVDSTDDAVWLYGGPDSQALLLKKKDPGGTELLRYIPVAHLRQDEKGVVTYEAKEFKEGFPLKYFEDPALSVPQDTRGEWLADWHDDREWMRATHQTMYSNAIVGLAEHMHRHPLYSAEELKQSTPDERLIRQFRQRQRDLTEADILITARNHWNFDVRGFNPGGNHGSFLRASTNSTLMIAGGGRTGIPKGLRVNEPYDNLSFAPTILRLMGKVDVRNEPSPNLRGRGFRQFPGRVIEELFPTRQGVIAISR